MRAALILGPISSRPSVQWYPTVGPPRLPRDAFVVRNFGSLNKPR